jgi:hypothetical protein
VTIVEELAGGNAVSEREPVFSELRHPLFATQAGLIIALCTGEAELKRYSIASSSTSKASAAPPGIEPEP